MRNLSFITILLLLIVACNMVNKEENNYNRHTIKVVEAKGYVVPKDSMAEPTVIPVDESKLKKVQVGKPKVVPDNLNVYPVVDPKAVLLGKPRVCTPGKDTFSLPKTIAAIHNPVIVKQPKSIPSLPFRMKDRATSCIQYLDVDEGMISSYVYSILMDKCGNLWFGTTGGVTKYDGKSFTHFTEKEGLGGKLVTSILEDKNGNLWFGSRGGGVTKYDGKSFTYYTPKLGLCSDYIFSMLEDKSGNIWFGTNGGGACKFDGKYFTNFSAKDGLSDYVLSIIEDKNGNIWFGSVNEEVVKYDGKVFTHYSARVGLSSYFIVSLLEDIKGNIWFGTNGAGVCKFDGESFSYYTDKEGLSNNDVRTIFEDKNHDLWFGTAGGGVNKYDGKYFTHYTEKEGLSSNYVYSVIDDESGNLWFGTDGGGVSKFRIKSFLHYTNDVGLSHFNVKSILEDRSGNLWFSTAGGGVNRYDGKCFTHYTEREGLLSNNVRSIIEDKNGNIWFGSNDGACKYDGSYFTYFIFREGLGNNSIVSMFEDKKGNVWFGTQEGGAIKFSGKHYTYYAAKEGLSNNVVISIIEDKAGNLWFATDGAGVIKYDGKFFTHYTKKEGLSNNSVVSTLEDKAGNLWFATSGGGICKFNGDYFTHFTENNGLGSNDVSSIIEDKNGKLWFGTNSGLNYFDPSGEIVDTAKRNNEIYQFNPKIIVLQKEDGLKSDVFNRNSVIVDGKNKIWWGTGKALSVIDMNRFKFYEKSPEINLETIYLQGNFVDFNNILNDSSTSADVLSKIIFADVAKFYNYPINLELPFNINHLTFHFIGIDWNAPHKIKYQYKLEGLDDDWSNLTSENKADYRNIRSGKYTFKIKAIGAAGKWSKTFDYEFVIHPPWWRTWWAYSSYAIILIGALMFFIQWRERKLKFEKEILEKTVEGRTEELVQKNIIVEQQKHLVEEKHKEITDSINYAERIQRSFLATEQHLNTNLNEYFLLFKPKDVVSGDFYWSATLNNGHFALATADSTGHGVPGAIMSLLNITSLEKAIETYTEPSDILNATRKIIIERLKKDGSEEGGKDGMDCSLCVYDFKNSKLNIAASNNPVWIVRGEEVIEIKPDKMPVGKHDRQDIPFTQQEIDLQKDDVIYTLTDGFPDQFGGERGKKFMIKNLRELLAKNAHLPMQQQKQLLENTFSNWVGNLEQVDDVTVIGIRV